ncbi:MAG: reverse transcriptase domain-containing protein, partial [Candidatus Aenigmatarchaeota archaeon]
MDVSTKQQKIAKIAEKYSDESIKSLNHYIDIEWLREAYRRTKKDTAAGVDNVTAEEYEKELDTNLRALLDRFKGGTYKAPPVKRVYIPKDEAGKEKRAIGIPTLEDKLLQRAVKMVLEPVLEVFFKDCSFGFRPERSIQEAEEEIWQTAMNYGGCWVLEVDIRKYFDSITHQHLRKFYRDKVCDGVIVRMLDKWLKAGILE